MKKSTLFVVVAFLLCTAIPVKAFEFESSRKLQMAYKIIENFYIDEVNGDSLVDEAIIAMLKTLDPHSAYSDKEETKQLTEPLDGSFSGIGIQFNMNNDTLYVVQVISGGPSEKVGILPGDRIISANDTIISGVKKKNADIIKTLRGPKGSKVDVKVLRRGVAELIDFRITRDDIPLYSVDASYMADPTTGYIRISRFAADTPKEVEDAMKKLKKQGMKNLIIDVESNGGGYLGAAYELSSKFLKNKELVVYTEGLRVKPTYFYTEGDGDFLDGRIVVMVNQTSASASEILAGALQDNDRGLVVGRRTFGKGLVQRPFPLPDGTMIRLTTSRYHTPSGRCIQKPYKAGEVDDYRKDILHRYETGEFSNADSVHFDESLKYTTLKNNRVVYGGGGIMPDLFVPIDTTTYSDYYRNLVAKGILNKCCIDFVDKNRKELKTEYPDEESFIARFNVADELMGKLVDMGTQDSVKYDDEQYKISESMMRVILKALIAGDLFDNGSYYRVANVLNPTYRQALELINDKKRYNDLLKGTK